MLTYQQTIQDCQESPQSLQQVFFSQGENKAPLEITEIDRAIFEAGSDFQALFLSRGQYRVTFSAELGGETFPAEGAIIIRNKQVSLLPEGETELKRVYIYKLDAMPPDETGKVKVTAVFHVLDNPLWGVAVVLGLLAAAGIAGASYAGVDSVETFKEELGLFGKGLGVAAAVVGALFLLFNN